MKMHGPKNKETKILQSCLNDHHFRNWFYNCTVSYVCKSKCESPWCITLLVECDLP